MGWERVGFTGSRAGMSPGQLAALRVLLADAAEFHHGDCVGADAQAHGIALEMGVPIVLHPPSDARLRAYCAGAGMEMPEAPYLVRNRAIVNATDILVAAPDGPERVRSGTWATVRYARSAGRRVEVLAPPAS